MASLKLSIQDKKDLDKFTKFLALKAAQIIVQSRLGDKISTQSKPYTSGTDWFNLAVQDLPDVIAEAKQAICSEVGTTRLPVCVEISLRTAEGDTMVLETWCLSSLPEQCDPTIRVTYTVYNRMGILLKSLVSVTRVTPAYKLSRRQSPDSYVICYRIYMGEPQFHNLGDGYKQVRVGQLCTPTGTLHLSVAYRTKMTISPTQTGRDNSIMLKSDHFNPENDIRHIAKKDDEQYEDMMSRPLKKGAFVDPEKINYPATLPKPFEKLWEKPKTKESVQTEAPKSVPKPVSLITKKKKEPTFKEIRPLTIPFADPDCNTWTQVSHLYWYFKDAPSLESLENGPTIGEQDIPGQIADFQKKATEYNSFVKQLLKTSKEDESDEDNEEKKKMKNKKEKKRKNVFSIDGKETIDVNSSENSSTLTRDDSSYKTENKDEENNEEESHILNNDQIKITDNGITDKENNNHEK